MSKYGFHIEWSEEDQGFIATCPDFPGLSAFGETTNDALKEAEIALELFIESFKDGGKQLPSPTKVQDYSGQFRLRTPKSLHETLANKAKREGISLNSYTVHLLSYALGQQDAFQDVKVHLRRIEQKIHIPVMELFWSIVSEEEYNIKLPTLENEPGGKIGKQH